MTQNTIPFFQNRIGTGDNPDSAGSHCQEASLQSILNYFEPEMGYSFSQLCQITGRTTELAVWAFQYSIRLVDNGYEVQRWTTVDYPAFAEKGIDYIRGEYGAEIAEWQEQNTDFATALELANEYIAKVELVAQKPTVAAIDQAMSQDWLAKVMVDAGVLNDLGHYLGHSVVVTSVNEGNVTFHDNGLPPQENRVETGELFQEAIDGFGGEMDLIRRR